MRVHSPSGITPHHVITHRGRREVHIMFIYEPIQALNVQKNPFMSFQARETTNIKGWSTCSKDMREKQQQERHLKY